MIPKRKITSEQIAEAMKKFGGVIHRLAPEVELQRSSVGFRPSQIAFEELPGFRDVQVELLEREDTAPARPATQGAGGNG